MTTRIQRLKQSWVDAFYADKVLYPFLPKRLGLYFLGLLGLGMGFLGVCVIAIGSVIEGFILLSVGLYLVIMYYSFWSSKAMKYINSKEKQNMGEA